MGQGALDLLIGRGTDGALRTPEVELRAKVVHIPAIDFPEPGGGAEIRDVFLVAAVGEIQRLRDAAPGVVVREMHAGAEPAFRLDGGEVARGAFEVAGGGADEGVEVAQVGRLALALAEQVIVVGAVGVLHSEDVPVLQSVLVFETVVRVFKGEVEAVKIAIELTGGRLRGGVDDPPVHKPRAGRGTAGEIRQAHEGGFIQAGEAAIEGQPGCDDRREIQRADGRLREAVVVRHLQEPSGVELELPLIFAGVVGGILTLHPVENVVIDHAIRDEGSLEAIDAVIVGGVRLAVLHIRGIGQQMPGPDFAHGGGGESGGRGHARLHGGGPCRHAIVAKVSEVRRRIVAMRRGGLRKLRVSRDDAVAQELAVLLQRAGQGDGVDGIAGGGITGGAVIAHGYPIPNGLPRGVGEAHMRAGRDNLIFQPHIEDAVGIGDFGGDDDLLAGGGGRGSMRHLTDGWRRDGSGRGIPCAGRGAGGTPTAAECGVQPGMDELEGAARVVADGGPCAAEFIRHAVDGLEGAGDGLLQVNGFAIVLEAAGPRSQRTAVAEIREQVRGIFRHDEIAACGHDGARGQGEVHAGGEPPAAHIDGCGGGIVEFDELHELRFGVERIAVDFIDHDARGEGRGGIGGSGCGQRLPGQHEGGDIGGEAGLEVRIGICGGDIQHLHGEDIGLPRLERGEGGAGEDDGFRG